MALTVLIIACFLLYSTSRYFTGPSPLRLVGARKTVTIISILLLVISFWLLALDYDTTTTIFIWIISLMTILSSIILTIKLTINWLYVWVGICGVLLMLDFI